MLPLLLLILVSVASGQVNKLAQCPDVLKYDTIRRGESRYNATITLKPQRTINNFVLDIELDRPTQLLGNLAGEVITEDNQEFTITARQRITRTRPYSLKLFLKYEKNEIPYIKTIRLNNKTICEPTPVLQYAEIRRGSTRYNATIKLATQNILQDSVLNIELYRPTHLLGNTAGEVTTEDNQNFLIDLKKAAESSKPFYSVDIFLNYEKDKIPYIRTIRLNNEILCAPPSESKDVEACSSGISGIATSTIPSVTRAPDVVVPTRENLTPSAAAVVVETSMSTTVKVIAGDCGRVQMPAVGYVSHGQTTKKGEWPWHVAIYRNTGNLTYSCGGSLIDARTVVTAAHCVTRNATESPYPFRELVLYFGKYGLHEFQDKSIQSVQIEHIYVHPEYNGYVFRADLAVITLIEDVRFTPFVQPICLWGYQYGDANGVIGKEGYVVGWGLDQTNKLSLLLTSVKLPVVDRDTCIKNDTAAGFYDYYANNRTLCAGWLNDTGVCIGDSGGGLVFPYRLADNSVQWVLRGLVSLSQFPTRGQVGCKANGYTIFTDIAQYLPWLSRVGIPQNIRR